MKSNPLATRYVAPGKIPWHSHRGPTLGQLHSKFVGQLHCRAAIVGPHGSGKSTLLEHLVPMLGTIALRRSTVNWGEQPRAADTVVPFQNVPSGELRSVVWLRLRGRSASGRLLLETRSEWARPGRLLVIDGYEQLSHFRRWRAMWLTRSSRTGLLVTAHHPTWLPTLIETHVDAALAQQVLEQLLSEDAVDRARMLDAHRLAKLLEKHHGNLRELFMELYDEF